MEDKKKEWYKKGYAAANMFLSPEERGWIIDYLINKYKPDTITVRYNEDDALFYLKKPKLFGWKETEVPEKDIKEAYEELWKAEKTTQKLEDLWGMYGEAVDYFYNDVYIDGKGIFRQKNFLSKKNYLTPYELDELKKKYKELHKD